MNQEIINLLPSISESLTIQTLLSDEQKSNLSDQGFLLLKDVLQKSEVEQISSRLDELWNAEGDDAGKESPYTESGVRRLANLLNKDVLFKTFALHPSTLDAVCSVIGPSFHLAMLNARDVLPGVENKRQNFHCDIEPYQNGGIPDPKGFSTCTVLWMITPSTEVNGATRLIPASHRFMSRPEEALTDLNAPHPDEVVVEGKPGDALIMNGHSWHCGASNNSAGSRTVILAHYLRADCPRDEWMYPELSLMIRASFSSHELTTLGIPQ